MTFSVHLRYVNALSEGNRPNFNNREQRDVDVHTRSRTRVYHRSVLFSEWRARTGRCVDNAERESQGVVQMSELFIELQGTGLAADVFRAYKVAGKVGKSAQIASYVKVTSSSTTSYETFTVALNETTFALRLVPLRELA